MSTLAASQTAVERVLVEATSLLLERARIELEGEVEAGRDSDAAASLRRVRELEDALRAIRQERAAPVPVPLHREVSRFYEVPGQEDA